jgi:DinB family protein
MPNLHSALEKLKDSQQLFLRAADAVPQNDWKTLPRPECWSAGHVVSHLCLVERSVLGYSDRVIRKQPFSTSFLGRLHLPISLVESRFLKRKSPAAVAPVELQTKEIMLADLRGVRERTLAFLEETRGRDLSVYCWAHPFLGKLNFYNWFVFVAAHQARHTKQMVEIAENLPKRVVPSQK